MGECTCRNFYQTVKETESFIVHIIRTVQESELTELSLPGL